MVEQTNKGEKFSKARAFMLANGDLARGLVNWRKMGWRTLYAAMALRGVKWDKVRKCWYRAVEVGTVTTETIKVSPPAIHLDSETVLVRIMAHNDAISQAVQNILELSRATDLLLVRNSGVLNAKRGPMKRVYLKFVLSKDIRK